MTTISFDEQLKLKRKHFETLEDFQLYIVEQQQKNELSENHKMILDERLQDLNENPENYLTIDELKSSIKRK